MLNFALHSSPLHQPPEQHPPKLVPPACDRQEPPVHPVGTCTAQGSSYCTCGSGLPSSDAAFSLSQCVLRFSLRFCEPHNDFLHLTCCMKQKSLALKNKKISPGPENACEVANGNCERKSRARYALSQYPGIPRCESVERGACSAYMGKKVFPSHARS